MTLQERSQFLSCRYYLRIKSNLQNPAYNHLIISDANQRRSFINNNQIPLGIRTQETLNNYGIRHNNIKPSFSYGLLGIRIATNYISLPTINFSLNDYPKASTPVSVYLQRYNELKRETYRGFTQIFTDGSKNHTGVGAACIKGHIIRRASLPREASIYSAEIHAIQMTIPDIENDPNTKFIIFSDSYSALKSLNNQYTQHPIVRKMLHSFYDLKTRGKTIEFCWIPSHMGIPGNELVDHEAKLASRTPEENIPIYYKDFSRGITRAFTSKRNEIWNNNANTSKLYKIKKDVEYWDIPAHLTRREEVILNRLRLGHCNFSHAHLMDQASQNIQPVCEYCTDILPMTVEHILVDCRGLDSARSTWLGLSRTQVNIGKVIGQEADINKLMTFLRNTSLFSKI